MAVNRLRMDGLLAVEVHEESVPIEFMERVAQFGKA